MAFLVRYEYVVRAHAFVGAGAAQRVQKLSFERFVFDALPPRS